MRRFNQGWLLNSDNGRVFWGFAVVLQVRDQNLSGSIKMFERARELLPNNPELLTDYGRILEGGGRYQDAIANFKAALAVDEKIPPAYYGLVRAYLGLKDIRRAAHYAEVGRKFGIPMSDDEIDELQRLADKQRE
jgi:tetratricopeptide (TPR) repeat protein